MERGGVRLVVLYFEPDAEIWSGLIFFVAKALCER